jgi:hypothetical protein
VLKLYAGASGNNSVKIDYNMTPDEQNAVDELEERYGAVSLNPNDSIPDQLYHYTSADGFFGIVSSGVLRATNFSYLNDSTEIQYGRRIAHKVIREHLKSTRSSTHKEVLTRAEKSLEDIGIGLEFYMACFCTKSDRLSQWRAYGSVKGRFCIGFDTNALIFSDLNYSLSRVIYNPDEQHRKVGEVIEIAIEALDIGSSPDFLGRVHELLTHKVINELCFFKDRGFEEEDEWRIVHPSDPTDKIDFDTSSGIIKPFVELWASSRDRSGACRLPIAEVIIGPSLFSSLSKKSAGLLLARYGYCGVEIEEFSVPFRDL